MIQYDQILVEQFIKTEVTPRISHKFGSIMSDKKNDVGEMNMKMQNIP